jgi:3-oxoadipate enol-lactonase
MASVNVNGINLVYEETGSGFPVILLHGFPFNRSLWTDQVEVLKRSFRVITPDLRGFGESSLDGDVSRMDDMAGDTAALMDHLEIDRAVIGGLSMGGYVTFSFYRMFPLRVRALILADTRPQVDSEEARKIRYEQAEKVKAGGMKAIVDGFLEKLLGEETAKTKPAEVARIKEMMLSVRPEGAAAALLGMAERRDHTSLLSKIIAPTLIVVGTEDKIVSFSDADMMHREIRGSHLEKLEGSGHVSNIEQRDEFNRALVSFLDSLQP